LWIKVFIPLLELNLIGNVDVNYFVSGKLIFKKVNQAIVRNNFAENEQSEQHATNALSAVDELD
jgi:hypothetical protein